MAGLLDFLNSDDAALGLGLLSASGPTTDPNQTGLGRVLANGIGYAQGVKRANAELSIKEAEARRKALIENLGIQLLGGGGIGGTSGAASPAGASVAGAGAAPAFGGANPQALGADFVFNGGKNIGGMIADRSKPNWQDVGGGNFVNLNAPGFQGGQQARTTVAQDGTASTINPDGTVSIPAGALDSKRAYEQMRTDVAAGTDVVKVTDTRQGSPTYMQEIYVPRSSLLAQSAAPQPQSQPQTQQRPALIGPGASAAPAAAQPAPQAGVTGNFVGDPAKVLMQLLEIKDPQERANAVAALEQQVRREKAASGPLIGPGTGVPQPGQPLPVQTTVAPGGGGGFVADLSPQQKAANAAQQAAATSVAEQTGGILKSAQDSANSAVQTVGSANRLRAVLDSGSAFTGKGANVKLTALQLADALGFTGKDAAEKVAQTRAAIQDLAKLTLEGRKQMSGQGSITIDEGKLAERAISGDIDLTPEELKVLANSADRSARFKYKVASEQIGAAGQGNPALAAQLPMFAPQPLPDPFAPSGKGSAPAGGIPAGWSVKVK